MKNLVDISHGSLEGLNVIIEIPKGSSNKYEYDEKLEVFRLDRALHSAMFFPFDYGFIPQTRAEDMDPLDAIVLTEQPTFPGCVIKTRIIGALKMEDQAGNDIKIITVPISSIEPRKSEIKSIKDLPNHVKKEIQDFMLNYKKLEPGKWAKVHGFLDVEHAKEIIRECLKRYKEMK